MNDVDQTAPSFGGLRYVHERSCLVRQADGSAIPMRAQSLAVFRHLAQHHDTVVDKDVLIKAVWADIVVTDDSLVQCIADIRRALGDTARDSLRTIPRRGYMLIADAPVEPAHRSEPRSIQPPPVLARPSAPRALSGRLLWPALGLVLLIGAYFSTKSVPQVSAQADQAAEPAVAAALEPGQYALSLQVTTSAQTDPAADSALLQATLGEVRAALHRYSTVRLADRDDTDLQLRLGLDQASAPRRVLVEAIDRRDGAVFWSRGFDLTDGADAARAVAPRIAAFASPGGGALSKYLISHARRKPVEQISRPECYALGYACTTCSGDVASITERATACLARLLEDDPNDATAWALKSTIHTHQYRWGSAVAEPQRTHWPSREPLRDQAVQAASRAEALNPAGDSSVFWAMAQAYSAKCDIDKMRVAIDRGLAINPTDPAMMAAFGNWMGFAGAWDEGVGLVERALAIEPQIEQPWWNYVIAKRHYIHGRYQQAYDEFLKVHNEQNWLSHLMMVYTLPFLGRLDEAREAVAKLKAAYPGVTIEKVTEFEKAYCIPDDLLARWREAMMFAGVPSQPEATDPQRLRPPAARVITVGGAPVEYMDVGQGEPVVFVHGALGDYRAWGLVQVPVARQFRFLSATLLGHGTQPEQRAIAAARIASPEPWTIRPITDRLEQFLDELKTGPVHLVTWSAGGPMGSQLALSRPDLVRSIVHFEPTFTGVIEPGPELKAAQADLVSRLGPALELMKAGDLHNASARFMEAVFDAPVGSFDQESTVFRQMIYDNAYTMPSLGRRKQLPDELSCADLGRIRAPTLVIHGGESNRYFKLSSRRFAECTPGARMAVMPGVHHDGPLRNTELFTELMLNFISEHSNQAK